MRRFRRLATAALATWVCCIGAGVDGVAETGTANGKAQKRSMFRVEVAEALDTAHQLILAGQPEAAYRLLRRAMNALSSQDGDTTAIRFLAAQALLAGGHYAQAAQLLGQLAEERPDLLPVRLEHATLLFDLGRDDEADAVLRSIRRTKDLSPVLRRDVERLLERIRGRQRWRLDFDIGLWHDDNVNNAPERATVAVPALGGLRFTLDQQPIPAWVVQTGAHLRWRESVGERGRAFFETQASVSQNTAIGADAYNRTRANIATGPVLPYSVAIAGRQRPGLIRAKIGAERWWRGGAEYAISPWASLELEQAFQRNWRIGASPRVWATYYDEGAADIDAVGRSIALNIARRVGIGWLTASGRVSREKPKRQSRRWASTEVSLRYATHIGRNWSISAWTGLSRIGFDAVEPLFRKRRKDRTPRLGLMVSHRALAWEGYLPELTLNWSRTTSSIPLYDREVRTLRIGVRRLF